MKRLSFFLIGLIIGITNLNAQSIRGKVMERVKDEVRVLTGVNVYWSGTSEGTTTDSNGEFKLDKISGNNMLVFSFVSYGNDTVDVTGESYVEMTLKNLQQLEGVEIVHRRKSTEISFIDPVKIERINEKELLKAACCNLSESFETSPSVDVSFTDAITGTREIKMLGLAGNYVQITTEAIPDIYGLAKLYGLTYIPGTWIEGIQLNKGTGSVVNGYESIAGQINVELRKPESSDPLYANFYINQGGRKELNLNFSKVLSEKIATTLLLHGSDISAKNDVNDDGFLDNPLSQQFIGLSRWRIVGKNGFRGQFGIKTTFTENLGGEVDFDPDQDEGTINAWGLNIDTRRIQGWSKIGKVYESRPWKSIGLQISAINHYQKSYYAMRRYDADQRSFYSNLIYASILSNTKHQFKTGASFKLDNIEETVTEINYKREEIVPGAFFEYSFLPNESFTLVAGLRGDYHNLFGTLITPRLHLRYMFTDQSVIRISGGRGYRTANIFAENSGLFASSRQIVIQESDDDLPYGLEQEVAWNSGINFTHCFRLNGKDGNLTLDYYHTQFENQIVVDREQSPQEIKFYNLDGSSFGNSFQAQLDYELLPQFDIRLAYRWYDVQIDYSDQRRTQPLLARNRAFLNLAYESENGWRIDNTINWQGEKRIPSTSLNPENYRAAEKSDAYWLVNAQVSKNWNNKWEVYVGVEDLFNFRQEDPILANDDPFSEYFDASLVWGPIFGRNTYLGLRYWIK